MSPILDSIGSVKAYGWSALFQALQSGYPVLPIFIFDPNILDKLDKPFQSRVQFIHETLASIHDELLKQGTGLNIMIDTLS